MPPPAALRAAVTAAASVLARSPRTTRRPAGGRCTGAWMAARRCVPAAPRSRCSLATSCLTSSLVTPPTTRRATRMPPRVSYRPAACYSRGRVWMLHLGHNTLPRRTHHRIHWCSSRPAQVVCRRAPWSPNWDQSGLGFWQQVPIPAKPRWLYTRGCGTACHGGRWNAMIMTYTRDFRCICDEFS